MIELLLPGSNPVVRREAVRLRRRWRVWLPLLLLGWVPAAWFLRVYASGQIALATPYTAGFWVQSLLVVARPDVLTGLFLSYLVCGSKEWHASRGELAATLLTPHQIIAGKCLVPVAAGAALNVASAFLYYRSLWDGADNLLELPNGRPIWTGGLILAFAVLEDVFYSTIVAFVAVRCYLFGRDPLLETFRAAGGLLLVGLLLAVLSQVADAMWGVLGFPVLLALAGSRILQPNVAGAWEQLMANAFFFGLLLPAEWAILRRLLRSLLERVPVALAGEEQGEGPRGAPALIRLPE